MSKISGPLLDRIDIHIEVSALQYHEITDKRSAEPSLAIRNRVKKTRTIQKDRFKGRRFHTNSLMKHKDIKKYCEPDEEGKTLLKMAIQELGISARAYDRILKVARTIADLEESENIQAEHISEAIQYRTLDRQLWI